MKSKTTTKTTHRFIITDNTTRPEVGEIAQRTDDLVVFRCPACRALQFAIGKLSGPDNAPTVDVELECGCKSMCGEMFSVIDGKVIF